MDRSECSYVNKKGHKCKRLEAVPGIYFCNWHNDAVHNLKIGKSAIKGAGTGLFAGKKGFKKGDIIGEYSRYDIKTRGDPCLKSKDYSHNCSSYLYCDETWCFDARFTPAIIIRHANDARSRKNNSSFEDYRGRVFLVADKKIKKGQEIFANYGEDYDWSFLD